MFVYHCNAKPYTGMGNQYVFTDDGRMPSRERVINEIVEHVLSTSPQLKGIVSGKHIIITNIIEMSEEDLQSFIGN